MLSHTSGSFSATQSALGAVKPGKTTLPERRRASSVSSRAASA